MVHGDAFDNRRQVLYIETSVLVCQGERIAVCKNNEQSRKDGDLTLPGPK